MKTERICCIDADVERRVIVDTGGIDIGDLLVKGPLRGADNLDTAGKFFKIVKRLLRVFQPLIIENKALDDIFFQLLGGRMAFHPVSDGVRSLDFLPVMAASLPR